MCHKMDLAVITNYSMLKQQPITKKQNKGDALINKYSSSVCQSQLSCVHFMLHEVFVQNSVAHYSTVHFGCTYCTSTIKDGFVSTHR